MPVNSVQWRIEIGVFDALRDVRYTIKFSRSSHTPFKKKKQLLFLFFFVIIVYVGGYRVKYTT